MGSRAQKRAPLNQAYVANVYEACRTIQGCSDVLTGSLLAIERQASAAPDRPRVDVRASFVDAVKYFSAQHGPTDSVFVDKEEHFHRREGALCYNEYMLSVCNNARWRASGIYADLPVRA